MVNESGPYTTWKASLEDEKRLLEQELTYEKDLLSRTGRLKQMLKKRDTYFIRIDRGIKACETKLGHEAYTKDAKLQEEFGDIKKEMVFFKKLIDRRKEEESDLGKVGKYEKELPSIAKSLKKLLDDDIRDIAKLPHSSRKDALALLQKMMASSKKRSQQNNRKLEIINEIERLEKEVIEYEAKAKAVIVNKVIPFIDRIIVIEKKEKETMLDVDFGMAA
jgi:hypothetical protein